MIRSEELTNFLQAIKEHMVSFENANFSDINWCNSEGENALHIAVYRNEYEICKELVSLGIEINARGDLGNTPLHEVARMENFALVEFLVESGADVYALTEGYPPFTYAKTAEIREYLREKMKEVVGVNKAAWAKAQISYLNREIKRIEKMYGL